MKIRSAVGFVLVVAVLPGAMAQSGRELIEASLARHAPPSHVYEEQALVTTDRQGRRSLRTLRAYTLRDQAGCAHLRVIETPADARGSALSIACAAQGRVASGAAAVSAVFGSGFTIADLESERPQDFRYERDGEAVVGRILHHVLRAVPVDGSVARRTGYHERRIYLRQDNLFISRIDYCDREGRQTRRQTFRDPLPDESGVWRARMILMEDLRAGERSLIKVERRVHSADYVPAAVFAGLRTDP